MRKIAMTKTDMVVSQLALGAAQFGTATPKETAFRILDEYVDNGGNLIDTAHVYGMWIPGTDSPSEETIGQWLKISGKRDQVYISTKGGHPALENMNKMRVTPKEVEADLNGSLQKLGTDRIDIYFLHRDDPDVPIEEILGFLEEQVQKGKIRYYGCSNWGLDRMARAQETAKKLGYHGFVCNQIMGCLADVHPETLPPSNVVMDGVIRSYHTKTQMSFMAYMSLARAYFIRRANGKQIDGESLANYTCPSNERILKKLRELEGEGYSILDYCLQYLVQQAFPTIPIAGFGSAGRVEEAIRAIDCDMPADLLSQVASLKELQ